MSNQMAPVRRNRRPVPGATQFDQQNPIIYLGTVAGAKKARARTGTLIAPLDVDFEILAWPVLGLSVLLVTEPEYREEAKRLGGVLVRDGADLVVIVDGTRNPPIIRRSVLPTVFAPLKQRDIVDAAPDFD